MLIKKKSFGNGQVHVFIFLILSCYLLLLFPFCLPCFLFSFSPPFLLTISSNTLVHWIIILFRFWRKIKCAKKEERTIWPQTLWMSMNGHVILTQKEIGHSKGRIKSQERDEGISERTLTPKRSRFNKPEGLKGLLLVCTMLFYIWDQSLLVPEQHEDWVSEVHGKS